MMLERGNEFMSMRWNQSYNALKYALEFNHWSVGDLKAAS
jgi:hypothetical protein